MKIVFLDFDGVITTDQWRRTCGSRRAPIHEHLNTPMLKHVNRIVETTKAKVVASTNWRLTTSQDGLSSLLKKAGAAFNLLSTTPTHFDVYPHQESLFGAQVDRAKWRRGHEVLAWLIGWANSGGEDIESFVILDDLPRSDFDDFGRNHLFSTDPRIGLTSEMADRAIRFLSRSHFQYNPRLHPRATKYPTFWGWMAARILRCMPWLPPLSIR